MQDTQHIFFDLIQIAIGVRNCLRKRPTPKQWKQVYEMAQKQSLVGICFYGVQKISNSDAEDYCGMTELQYLTWMGMAAKIQQQNEAVDIQCTRVQEMLAVDGLRSCILKGQGVALAYPSTLHKLRQPGDIDVWVDAPKNITLAWAAAHGTTNGDGDLHVAVDLFPDTDVELHFIPSVISGKKRNRKLQAFFESQKEACMTNVIGQITAPTLEFNHLYLLQHIFRHYLYEGIGLRHVMDYYMALCSGQIAVQQSTKELVRTFSMEEFACALMWVIQQVFGGDVALDLPWELDEKRGRRLLEVIMEGGNFGHDSEKYKVTGWDKPFSRIGRFVRRNWYMMQDYPEEIMWNLLKKLKF